MLLVTKYYIKKNYGTILIPILKQFLINLNNFLINNHNIGMI